MNPADREVAMTVAANMQRYRVTAGMTQAELGEKLGGWSKVAVSAAERSVDGKRVRAFTIGEVVRIAGILGVTVTDMITSIPPCEVCWNRPPAGMICQTCGTRGPEVGQPGAPDWWTDDMAGCPCPPGAHRVGCPDHPEGVRG